MNDLSPKQLNRLFSLFGSLRDGMITEQEFSELSGLLDSSTAAQEYYVDYVCLCTDLDTLQASLKSVQPVKNAATEKGSAMDLLNPQLNLDMLRIWADYEKTAEALELPEINDTELVQVQKLPFKPVSRKVSKLTIGTLIGSIAALLFLLAYVLLNPRYSLDVATVSNAVDAQWSSSLPLQRGTRLAISSSDPIQLHKGFVEIESDNNVSITIEAPAEFRFVSADEVQVTYGQIFATVAPEGRGFSVQTPNSKIIDLGTRFGVFADLRGKTELHVFKGKTILIAGQKSQDKKTVEVSGGQACRVDAYTNDVTNITLNQNMFAQGIDSQSGLVITGGQRIDLADIVGGGDGTGNGAPGKGLKWDGTSLVSTSDMRQDNVDFPSSYVDVTCNPLIDGIFMPYGKGEEPLVLTSDTATLNLDDFIASDTNGLLTLMLVKQVTDDNSMNWFCSKEAAGGISEKYPTLEFPNASSPSLLRITTAYKNGADAYVSNDLLRSPRQALGQWPTLNCRYSEGQRAKIIYLRFDISDVKGDLTGAVLNLYLNFANRYRDLDVYGLVDGPADLWDEATICYQTAPGLLDAELGHYQLQEDVLSPLGTFAVIDNRIETVPIPVDSTQTCLWTAPTTKAQSVGIISNAQDYWDDNGTRQSLMLDGISCGTRSNPSIFMHANAGVTFDLDAIRREYGPISIESFTAICGISRPATLANPDQTTVCSLASFYVLVDGREVFNAIDVSPVDTPQQIDIKLNPQARYLTLVAAQGTDNSIMNDACLFVNPTLNLK